MTIHHSICAHNRLRNPRTTAGGATPPELDFRNNVVYDWKEFASHTGSEAVHLNLVNSYYKPGPSTGIEDAAAREAIFTFMSAGPHRLYAAGNVPEGDDARSRDNWAAVRFARKGNPATGVRATAPLPTPKVTTQTAAEAFDAVLADAGTTLPARDAVGLRIVTDIRRGTGINYETDIPEPGRWQLYRSLPAPADSDADGIPDYWRQRFSLPPNSAVRAAAGGYANIEAYVK